MNIDNLDFTPWFYAHRHGISIMSKDEHEFLIKTLGPGLTWRGYAEHRPEWKYLAKLHTYYERFDNHMPIPLRKSLLREIRKAGAVIS